MKMSLKILLSEKYRPKTFADLVGNTDIIKEIAEMVKNKNIPHLLLSGNAGLGKTSLALVIANKLYNGVTKFNVKEVNASDENGIAVMRGPVKVWAEQAKPVYQTINGKSVEICSFKLVILDEADNMTPQAMAALRRTMEKWHKKNRFIIICNYKWKIIDPIISRCSVYDFQAIKPEEMFDRVQFICEQEKIDIDKKSIEYICQQSNGDMRSVFNNYLERLKLIKGKIPLSKVKRFDVDLSISQKILKESLNGRFLKGRQAFEVGLKRGYNIRQLIKDISEYSAKNGYPNAMKGDISLAALESEKLIIDGCTTEIVTAGLVARLMKIGKYYLELKNNE